ncbi:MAG TPA: carboxypeptidase regulatory-like domain-containing protein, partial [Gemmatimonadaceae bacterium]
MRFSLGRSRPLITLIAAVITATAASTSASAQGTVRGSVTDASGRPAAGATIHIVGTQLGAIVDSAGSYRVNGIPAGTVTIRVLRLGFSPDSATLAVA